MLHDVVAPQAIDPRGAMLSPDSHPPPKPMGASPSDFTAGRTSNTGVANVAGADSDDRWSADSVRSPAHHGAPKPNAEGKPTTSTLQQYEKELAQQLARV
jgi:hypothetical protein